MFQVLHISSHTGDLPSTPLFDCLVDDMLLQTRPRSNLAPLQSSNVEYGRAVDTVTSVLIAPYDYCCTTTLLHLVKLLSYFNWKKTATTSK